MIWIAHEAGNITKDVIRESVWIETTQGKEENTKMLSFILRFFFEKPYADLR